MSLTTYLRAHAHPLRRHLAVILAGAVGVAAGAGLTWLLRDPHTATTETLAGTVTWSNADTRLIAFDVDGEIRDPLAGDTIYYVVSDDANLPPCLAATGEDGVRQDRRRVEVKAIHQSSGGPQKFNLATSLRCLD